MTRETLLKLILVVQTMISKGIVRKEGNHLEQGMVVIAQGQDGRLGTGVAASGELLLQ
jgi:hypothetical protein